MNERSQGMEKSARGSGKVLLLFGSAAGAVSNFAILFVVARQLDVQGNEEFLVFWSLLFGLFGVLSGIQNETTRATSCPTPVGARAFTAGVTWGLISMLLVSISSTWWATALLPASGAASAIILAVTALLYPVYITVVGALGGFRRWDWYGGAVLVEVGMRMLFVLGAIALGGGLVGVEVGSSAAVLALGIVLVAGNVPRRAIVARTDVSYGRLLINGALAMTSTTFTALLVTGFPVLLKITNPADSMSIPTAEAAALTGACILAISLTRAPIMMPLTAFVGVAISAFTSHSGSAWSAVRRPFLILAGVGFVGAIASWPIGPWVLRLFKDEYELPGWYFAALTASSVLLGWLTILGALAVATKRHVLYSIGWGLSLGVAFLCLLLPGSLLQVSALSLALGPAMGCAVFLTNLKNG